MNKVGSTKPKIVLKKDKVKKEFGFTFEEKLRGYAFRKVKGISKKIDLIASKEAFMSAEEVYEKFPNLNQGTVIEVWNTFPGPTTGIPVVFLKGKE